MNVTDDKQERQVVSRQRVADHGEVYTAKREVNAMLDLVKEETERIDSRFLEPACGNGNFLVEILSRKMEAVRRKYVRNRFEGTTRLRLWSLVQCMLLSCSVVALNSVYAQDFERLKLRCKNEEI